MKATLALGLAALVALTALAAIPAASAHVDVQRCKSDYTPNFPQADPCVHVVVDPTDLDPADLCVQVWVDGVGGTHPC